jgi:acylphosphatase
MAANIDLIRIFGKSEYFRGRGWTAGPINGTGDLPVGQVACRRLEATGISGPAPTYQATRLAEDKEATMGAKQAISGTVTGNDQHVGFRAMIMKQAIEYNLGGYAKNEPNDVVSFTLQGEAKRLEDAAAAIREGTKKSSNIEVKTTPGTVDPALDTFTIFAWTSTTRNITNPYDLVFRLRPDDDKLSGAEVKEVWHGILKSTLKGDDLKKLGAGD